MSPSAPSSPGTLEPGTLPAGAPTTKDGVIQATRRVLLLKDEIPNGPWTSPGPMQDSFREVICGASTEPVRPLGSSTSQWINQEERPLIQTARPVGPEHARKVISDLKAAVGSCPSAPTAEASPGTAQGAQAFALADPEALGVARQRPGETHWTFTAFVPLGDCLVAYTTFAQKPEPPTEFLDALVAAGRKKATG